MADDSETLLKLVIINRIPDKDSQVLADTTGVLPALPEVRIPRFTRIGYSATTAAREKWGLELFVILSVHLKAEHEDSGGIEDSVLICRLQDVSAEMPEGLEWREEKQVLVGDSDRLALDAAFREFEQYDSGPKVSSFGRYASLDELRTWYRPQLEKLRVRETSIHQWNGDPWFALFRIKVEPCDEGTSETPKALWFKAVGEPNTREFSVTLALTKECPNWFPRIVATKPELNGWLMEEVNGHELDEEIDGRLWALTARILAKIQRRFIGKEDQLLKLGCRDWRVPRVLDALDLFFEDMGEIMRRQHNEPPLRLDRSQLAELKVRCQELCHRVEDVDIPYTIAHGDFSPHNVIVGDGSPVLLDWAEAYVGLPFISWEYFWNRLIREHPEHADWRERMHFNYAYRVWAPLLTKRRVDEGLRLSPAMAVLIHALYGTDRPQDRQNHRADKVKRSLVRRLHRELEILHRPSTESVGAL